MFGWVREKIAKASAQNQVKNDLGDAVEAIKKSGGADRIVLAYVDHFSKNDEKMARFRCGLLKPDEYPMHRMLISTAAINSIMAARRDIEKNAEDDIAEKRLNIAEYAFLLSWLHLEERDTEHITSEEIDAAVKRSFDVLMETQDVKRAYAVMPHKKVADERMKQGEEALEKWRVADVRTFPITVPI